MAGRFSNTKYSDTMNSLLGTMKKAVKNNYYKYSDKAPTPVEYFHIDKDASTLDEGSRLAYNNVGEDSPFLYNRIPNMIILGIDQMSMQYTNDEYGVKSEPIEGEGIILPDIIIPYEDDQFIISYDKNQIIFTSQTVMTSILIVIKIIMQLVFIKITLKIISFSSVTINSNYLTWILIT